MKIKVAKEKPLLNNPLWIEPNPVKIIHTTDKTKAIGFSLNISIISNFWETPQ